MDIIGSVVLTVITEVMDKNYLIKNVDNDLNSESKKPLNALEDKSFF